MMGFRYSGEFQHREALAIFCSELVKRCIAKLRVYLPSPDQYDSRTWIFHHPCYKARKVLNLRMTSHGSWVIYYVATDGGFELGSCRVRAFLHLKFRTWLQRMKAVIII